MFDLLFIFSLICSIVEIFREVFISTAPAIEGHGEVYPEPHRNPQSGRIIIENCKLYHEDVEEYGVIQAQKWVKQGRYNLSPEELVKEKERIRMEHKLKYR